MKYAWLLFFISISVFAKRNPFPQNPFPLNLEELFRDGTPTDDPDHYEVDISKEYNVEVSKPYWVSPSTDLPSDVKVMNSNNNVGIEFHQGRLYVAFRTSKTHFAGKKSKMYIISSSDGKNWEKEFVMSEGTDAREPQLLSWKGELYFYCFLAGTNPFQFKPTQAIRFKKLENGEWGDKQSILAKGEVPWELKIRRNKIWLTSYEGSHYGLQGPGRVKLFLKTSTDALNFNPQDPAIPEVHIGGSSEVGMEFSRKGDLWAVTRNEDGDETGFGSQVVFAPKSNISEWEFPEETDPHIYMSPRMFRHGKDIYLVGRRNLGRKPFGWASRALSWAMQRIENWVTFSLTPKTTALYKIGQGSRKLIHVMDLPGTGDTAFPSIKRVDAHTFIMANYSSPLNKTRRTWLQGQLGKTGIYLITLKFKPN